MNENMKTNENDYSVKVKYCPGMRRNVIIKVDNIHNNETCMDSGACSGSQNCAHGYCDSSSAVPPQ